MNKRIIKFRAYDKEKKKMFYGYTLAIVLNGKLLKSEYEMQDTPEEPFEIPIKYYEEDKREKRFELMQFIGLCDIAGKEIYEGDIVVKINIPNPQNRRVIEVKWTNNVNHNGFNQNSSNCAIIGNIFENPEILKSL